jgi:tetratricopeptide (TPR) repeat protein
LLWRAAVKLHIVRAGYDPALAGIGGCNDTFPSSGNGRLGMDSWRGVRVRVLYALGLVGLAVALAAGSHALAQEQGAGLRAQSRTVIGGSGNSLRCSQAAIRGTAADADLLACTTAIERDRLRGADLVATRINRGVMLLRRNDARGALADFDAVVALDPRSGEGHAGRGSALIASGQPGAGIAAITQALSLGVREPHKAYYNRGAAREALGDFPGAYEDYSTALRIKPDWELAEAELVRFVRSRRDRLARLIGLGSGPAAPTTQDDGRP